MIHKLLDERGASSILEASFLFPLTFLLVLMLFFLTFLFALDLIHEVNIQEHSLYPVSSKFFQNPDEDPYLAKKNLKAQESGFLFAKLVYQDEWIKEERVSKFSFHLPRRVKSRHVSPANNLWFFQSYRMFLQKSFVESQKKGD